jgi:hypothetical protein
MPVSRLSLASRPSIHRVDHRNAPHDPGMDGMCYNLGRLRKIDLKDGSMAARLCRLSVAVQQTAAHAGARVRGKTH